MTNTISTFTAGCLSGMGLGMALATALISLSTPAPQPETQYISALGYHGAFMGLTLTVDWEQYKRDNNIGTVRT